MEEMKNTGERNSESKNFFIETKGEELAAHEFPGEARPSFLKSFFGGKVIVSLLAIFLLVLVFLGVPGFLVYLSARRVVASGRELYASFGSQDISKIRKALENTENSIKRFDGSLKFVFWARPIPVLGRYLGDAEAFAKGGIAGLEAGREILDAAEPYAA